MLAFKYPDLFSSVVSYGAAVINAERALTHDIKIFPDREHFDKFSPWVLVEKNADKIRGNVRVRMVCGDQDRLMAYNVKFKELLDSLNIPVSWVPVPDVAHDTRELYRRVGLEGLRFMESGFAPIEK